MVLRCFPRTRCNFLSLRFWLIIININNLNSFFWLLTSLNRVKSHYSSWWHWGTRLVDVVAMGWWLDYVISAVFFNLDGFMIRMFCWDKALCIQFLLLTHTADLREIINWLRYAGKRKLESERPPQGSSVTLQKPGLLQGHQKCRTVALKGSSSTPSISGLFPISRVYIAHTAWPPPGNSNADRLIFSQPVGKQI